MAVIKGRISRVLVPCTSVEDESVLDSCRTLGIEATALYATRLYDLNRPAPTDSPAAYVKSMNPESVIDTARLFGAEAVFAPEVQPMLESTCRSAGLQYLDPGFFKSS